jgi:hypothetical protein
MQLYINGVLAVKGQEITTFKGFKGILTGWREPHKPSSTGRVYVLLEGDSTDREFFPGVVGGEFKND